MSLYTHPDWLAFTAAIIDQPDEDTPRLAAADWLDEQPQSVRCSACDGSGHPPAVSYPAKERVGADGRVERYIEFPPFDYRVRKCSACDGRGSMPTTAAERAEFIRVQVEEARLPGCDLAAPDGVCHGKACSTCPAREPLRSRAIELIEAHGREWFDTAGPPVLMLCLEPVPDLMREGIRGQVPAHVRRGWVEHLTLPAADWLAHAAALTAAHPVRRVTLTTWPPGIGRTWPMLKAEYEARWRRITFDLSPAAGGLVGGPVSAIEDLTEAILRQMEEAGRRDAEAENARIMDHILNPRPVRYYRANPRITLDPPA